MTIYRITLFIRMPLTVKPAARFGPWVPLVLTESYSLPEMNYIIDKRTILPAKIIRIFDNGFLVELFSLADDDPCLVEGLRSGQLECVGPFSQLVEVNLQL